MNKNLEYKVNNLDSKLRKRGQREVQDRLHKIYRQLTVSNSSQRLIGEEYDFFEKLSDADKLTYVSILARVFEKHGMKYNAQRMIEQQKQSYFHSNSRNLLDYNLEVLSDIPDSVKLDLISKHGESKALYVRKRSFKHGDFEETTCDIYVDGKFTGSKTVNETPKTETQKRVAKNPVAYLDLGKKQEQ